MVHKIDCLSLSTPIHMWCVSTGADAQKNPSVTYLGLHAEWILAQLAPLDVRRLYPPLEAVLVDVLEGTGAKAGSDEWGRGISAAVANLANVSQA